MMSNFYSNAYITKLCEKQKQNIELTIEDLKFLYELEGKIQGFDSKDPRIEEIKKSRNIINDLNTVFQNVVSYNGNLDLRVLTSANGLKLPQTINGNLFLDSITSAVGLVLPQMINGSLILIRLTSADGLMLPQMINGSLLLDSITSATELKLPETINGSLSLNSLTSASGLKLPQTINGYLNLSSLTSADGLMLPYGFKLETLLCKDSVKQQIILNSLYYYQAKIGNDTCYDQKKNI